MWKMFLMKVIYISLPERLDTKLVVLLKQSLAAIVFCLLLQLYCRNACSSFNGVFMVLSNTS